MRCDDGHNFHSGIKMSQGPKTIQDYVDLITSEFADQPKFTSMVSADVAPMVRVQALLETMIAIFDIDTPPVGNQLDIIGQWVGVTREVAIPITGVFFSWDGTDASLGWDSGTWAPSDASEITTLPDDAYLTLIKAKIAANVWDGTTNGAYAIWNSLFTDFTILIQDHQDMSYAVGIVGAVIDPLTQALITGGYIPLKPEGVRISEYFIAVDTGPVFAWDVPLNALLGGWDEASWAKEIFP